MTVKIDGTEPNVFPAVEGVDVHEAGRNAEVILGTKIEGELIPVTIKLSYERAEAFADLLEPLFGGGEIKGVGICPLADKCLCV
jgi:hypothetical protein